MFETIYKVGFDQDGRITGFYVIDHENAAQPTDAFVQVSQAEYEAAVAAQANFVIDGKPVFVPPPPPTDEQLADAARIRRGFMLAQSDWTQMPDVPDAMKATWAAYRQALRDITAQPGFPRVIDWPAAPA